MTMAQWVSIALSVVVALAGSSVLTIAITSWVNRNKLNVDISKTKADAAATLSDTAIRLATEQDKRFDKVRDAWHVHRQWDVQQVRRMRQAGWSDVEDPPDVWF